MAADLFDSLQLRETELPNRLMVSPMCQYAVEDRDGVATEWHHVHLGSRAVGGAGVVMSEATAVEPRGRISPEDLGIWSDEHADALERTTEFIKLQGAVPAIQLAHAGRKASTSRPWEGTEPLQQEEGGWTAVSPSGSSWPYDEGEPPETEKLTYEGIQDIVDSFRAAAERALAAGFEIAEVHGAHGYLLHEFLSPVTNDREDEYGGSFENRARLICEVTRAVRDVWPEEKPVFVRISGTDWQEEPSWTVEQSAQLADLLYEEGADLIDVSSGGISPGSWPDYVGPNYQLSLAEHVCENSDSDIGVGTVGGITTGEQAQAIVRNDRADLAIVGRKFLHDPYFGLHAAEDLGEDERNEPPVQYYRGFK